jgi:hypothetical protein
MLDHSKNKNKQLQTNKIKRKNTQRINTSKLPKNKQTNKQKQSKYKQTNKNKANTKQNKKQEPHIPVTKLFLQHKTFN